MTCLVVVLASSFQIVSETIFERFLIYLRSCGAPTTIEKLMVFLNIFASFGGSLLRPILDRFWLDFGPQH